MSASISAMMASSSTISTRVGSGVVGWFGGGSLSILPAPLAGREHPHPFEGCVHHLSPQILMSGEAHPEHPEDPIHAFLFDSLLHQQHILRQHAKHNIGK